MISTPIKIILVIFCILGIYSFLIALSPNKSPDLFSKIPVIFKINVGKVTPTPSPIAIVTATLAPVATISGAITSTPSAMPTQAVVVSSETDQLVYFDGKTFSPNNVAVTVGQKVVFKNISSDSLIVSSEPYPDASAYPELNSKEVITPGATFTFVAQKIGSWTYNNYIQPDMKGSLTVIAGK